MKKCKDIENNLSLYLDDVLSKEDKAAVDEHLRSCRQCEEALARLRKTKELTNSLHEVEPPPWFRKKIMARVREEAGKKNFLYKLFYPLQIKIPVQIFATVCIAVLAVYLYRAGENRFQEVVPSSVPAPVLQTQQDQSPEAKENTSLAERTQPEPNTISQKDKPRESVRKKEVHRVTDAHETDVNELKASDGRDDSNKIAPAQVPEQFSVESAQTKDRHVSGTALKASVAPRAQDSHIKPGIVLKVTDLEVAVREAEQIFRQCEAKNITATIMRDKAFLTGELNRHNIKDLLRQLSTIGRVEEKHIPAADAEGNTALVVEITNR